MVIDIRLPEFHERLCGGTQEHLQRFRALIAFDLVYFSRRKG
ncbi:MAG: hypothetical protein ABSE07_03295 [Methanoregula sp.]